MLGEGIYTLQKCISFPREMKEKFLQCNFLVKGSDQKFNQVDHDNSQEWLNSTRKKGRGLSESPKLSALSRRVLLYNLTASITAKTQAMFMFEYDEQMINIESTTGRMKQDDENDDKLVAILKRFWVLKADFSLRILLQKN